jgi:hypothetical protein
VQAVGELPGLGEELAHRDDRATHVDVEGGVLHLGFETLGPLAEGELGLDQNPVALAPEEDGVEAHRGHPGRVAVEGHVETGVAIASRVKRRVRSKGCCDQNDHGPS